MMKYIAIITCCIFLTSCGINKKGKDSAQDPILNKWTLNVLDGNKAVSVKQVYIEFTEDRKVTGYLGCNRLMGNYTIENQNQIKFNSLSTTRMACQEDIMALENQLLEILNATDNFTITDDKLMLNVGRRAPLAIFHKMGI